MPTQDDIRRFPSRSKYEPHDADPNLDPVPSLQARRRNVSKSLRATGNRTNPITSVLITLVVLFLKLIFVKALK